MYQTKDITILITCYKEGRVLLRAVESLKNQTVQGFQIILVNDASPDKETNEITNQLEGTPGIKVVRHASNQGLSGARNSGFLAMENEIAMPLDADDTLPPNAVEEALKLFNQHPEADLVFGNYLKISEDGGPDEFVSCQALSDKTGKLNPFVLARNWTLLGSSPCKKSLWEKTGGYSAAFSNTVQDVDFWRRAILAGANGHYSNAVLYHWHRTSSGMNQQVKESDYLALRIQSLPFYDAYHPDYGKEMRQYIYRYYAARLMQKPLQDFLAQQSAHFSWIQKANVRLMGLGPFYTALRKIKSFFKA